MEAKMAKIDTWIDLANLYYQAGALDKAITAYQKIIKQGYRFGSVYNNLASAFASQGNMREAIPHYQQCIELLSDPRERAIISTRLGECHRQVGEYDNAIAAFKKAFEIDPSNPAVLKGLGEIQSDLESYSQVDPQGDEFSASVEEQTQVLSSLDPASSDKTFIPASIDEFPQMATNPPGIAPDDKLPFSEEMARRTTQEQDEGIRATMLLTLGIMHWRNGNLEESEDNLRAAIDACAKIQNNWFQALSWHALALVKTDLGSIESAIGAYRQAVSLAPDQIFPWSHIGNLYNTLGCNDEAMLAFHRAIKQNPEDTGSWDGLGDIYTKLGRLDDGIAAYQLGNIFEKRPQGEDAIKAYEKAFQLYKFTLQSLATDTDGVQAGQDLAPESLTVSVQPVSENTAPTPASIVEDGNPEIDYPVFDTIASEDVDNPFPAEIFASEMAAEMQAGEPFEMDQTHENIVEEANEPVISEWNGLDDDQDAPVNEMAPVATPTSQELDEQSKEMGQQPTSASSNRPNDPERVASAISSFLKVIEINPDNDRAWDSLGNLYRITQRISDAIYAFEKAISLEPNKYLYRYQLGTCYAADGNYSAAVSEIRKALELNPAFVFAHCALASYLRKIGQQEEAQAHIALAAPLMMNQKEYDRACFESIRGNTAEAIELLRIALEKKQTTAEWIRRDLDLDFIRNDPRFDSLATNFAQSPVEYEKEKSR